MKTWDDIPEVGPQTMASLRQLFNSNYKRPLLSDDPLVDYMLTANLELLDPHPLFSTRFYLSNSLDVGYSGTNPLLHLTNKKCVGGQRTDSGQYDNDRLGQRIKHDSYQMDPWPGLAQRTLSATESHSNNVNLRA
ncbi:MAG: hypothetical protein DHS20C11_17000 [Lysobacteraceae bacterium]|nr:MAG: hypothetical protein DHS20C11_17000 [Xanthomonadaceae bacterium]